MGKLIRLEEHNATILRTMTDNRWYYLYSCRSDNYYGKVQAPDDETAIEYFKNELERR